MSEQTESYIVLKPIAERFNKIANEITDDEIKSLIKSEMKDQLKQINFNAQVEEIISEYIDNHQEQILDMFKDSINDRLKY